MIAIDQMEASIRAKEKLQTAVSLVLKLVNVTYEIAVKRPVITAG